MDLHIAYRHTGQDSPINSLLFAGLLPEAPIQGITKDNNTGCITKNRGFKGFIF